MVNRYEFFVRTIGDVVRTDVPSDQRLNASTDTRHNRNGLRYARSIDELNDRTIRLLTEKVGGVAGMRLLVDYCQHAFWRTDGWEERAAALARTIE